jgi:hypothetical protein
VLNAAQKSTEHEARSTKHGARGTEHEARSTRYGAQSTPRGAERKAQSTSEARSTMNERSPPKCTEQNARTFLFRAGAFCKRFSEKVYPIWVALKSPHHTQKIFKKITPFGSRRKVRTIRDSTFTPRDRYTFPRRGSWDCQCTCASSAGPGGVPLAAAGVPVLSLLRLNRYEIQNPDTSSSQYRMSVGTCVRARLFATVHTQVVLS